MRSVNRILVILLVIVFWESPAQADQVAASGAPPNTLVEIFLAPDRGSYREDIKRVFGSASITRVRIQVFRRGHPPPNLAVGRLVPAPVARLAIQVAIEHNRGVQFLLPQFRFFPDHIAIGTSAFDEASQIAISAQDLARLADPNLDTEQFHDLYRRLTGEDRRLPTYVP